MNQAERETLMKLAGSCAIRELRQTHLEAKVVRSPTAAEKEVVPEVEVALQIARNPTTPKSEFATIFRFGVSLSPESQPAEALVRMQYHAVLVYSVGEEMGFSDEDLRLFGQTNAMVHVWPYLRAFVQNSCAQIGAPIVSLPIFRVGQPLSWARNDTQNPVASPKG
ncbi:hypothetical protein [Myxococcus sp. AS-1-15]|uniref:hypothetical protein n=1 Tax=Myxococcus sp. AS-1-15 TaxID=2874600 RepID=UPI001CBA7922|nr:hypothetical protein [Myxococcus sp. AS-1-15]MBZ4395349.1 hypothetical protein [Myxococcus sp. AS-1-15]